MQNNSKKDRNRNNKISVLITGGGGFQGSHLAEFLISQGYKVSALNTRSKNASMNLAMLGNQIDLIWGSVLDKKKVEDSVRNHDVVFHMAAHVNVDESLRDPGMFLRVNILGTYNVLEAVKKYGTRLIHISSCEVYGDGHNLKKVKGLSETTEMKPNSPYAASKVAADRLCYSYFKSFGTNVTIVRPFNVFGERQKKGKFGALIPILTEKAMKGESLTIFGDGSAIRDYTYIKDMIRAYNLVLRNPSLKGREINFASGTSVSVKKITEYIADKFGVKILYTRARPGEVSNFLPDISLAKSLGYRPKITIWEGIDRYINWAKNNK